MASRAAGTRLHQLGDPRLRVAKLEIEDAERAQAVRQAAFVGPRAGEGMRLLGQRVGADHFAFSKLPGQIIQLGDGGGVMRRCGVFFAGRGCSGLAVCLRFCHNTLVWVLQ